MIKFSIIVPIYKVELYLKKCLESIANQTYSDFEALLIDDGSPDGSTSIAKQFAAHDPRFKYFRKNNGGLSDARNFGVTKATGQYLVFVDSDDYLETGLLQVLAEAGDYQMIRYFARDVDESGQELKSPTTQTGLIDLAGRYQFELVEAAWLYAYQRDFWLKYDFHYQVGRLHEDFGLTPLILAQAEQVYAIDYIGYNYLQRSGSITNDPLKLAKRFADIKWYFEQAKEWARALTKRQSVYYLNFMANGVLSLTRQLHGAKRRAFLRKLKQQKLYRYLAADSFKHLIKKILVAFAPGVVVKK